MGYKNTGAFKNLTKGEMMKIVAMKEQSDGNESVGSMWIETAIFEPTDTLADVLAWVVKIRKLLDITENRKCAGKYGRLMLSVADE